MFRGILFIPPADHVMIFQALHSRPARGKSRRPVERIAHCVQVDVRLGTAGCLRIAPRTDPRSASLSARRILTLAAPCRGLWHPIPVFRYWIALGLWWRSVLAISRQK